MHSALEKAQLMHIDLLQFSPLEIRHISIQKPGKNPLEIADNVTESILKHLDFSSESLSSERQRSWS